MGARPPCYRRSVAALPDDLAPTAESSPSSADAAIPSASGTRTRSTIRAYFLLTKPRVIELLLVTTVPAMVLAEEGLPALWLIAVVLLGGSMAAGGANTINCWIERDRDSMMRRTHGRPLPAGDVNPTGALIFGLVLEAAAFVLLWSTVNLLAASLAVSATLFYVFVYTLWLKPRSTQNIVIGGAAGAVPVLVGWAAVTGSLAAPGLADVRHHLLLDAAALLGARRSATATTTRPPGSRCCPSCGASRPRPARSWRTRSSSPRSRCCSLPVSTLSWGYAAAATVLGVMFIVQAIRLHGDPTPERAIKLFTFSNIYLALLFAAIAVDTLVRSI